VRVVAITELAGELEDEAAPIASLLGVSAYDVKARLAGALPKLLLQTADSALSERVRSALVARGHGAVELDGAAAVSSAQMVKLRRFTFDVAGVWANRYESRASGAEVPEGQANPLAWPEENDRAGDHLAWSDLGVVVVAVVRSEVARTTQELDYPGTSDESSRTLRHDVTKTEHSLTHVAYLFPRRVAAARTPWLLDEATAQFLSLGARMQPTRRANFFTTITQLREHAPHAIVDDRFVTSPRTASVVLHVRGTDATPKVAAGASVDLVVHVLAEWLMRDRSGPYR
jgi:hypothetical protein